MNTIIVTLIISLTIISLVYMVWMPGQSYSGPEPNLSSKETQMANSLQQTVQHLAINIGERHIHKPKQLQQAADFIIEQLKTNGYKPVTQSYEVENITSLNIEVELPGNQYTKEIVVIGAHYDSVEHDNCPAANDNATGVAAVLELAKTFATNNPKRTLRFVLFVNEEPPYFQTPQMGSFVYAKRSKERQENIIAMLSLETMGYFSDASYSQKYPFPFGLFYPSKGNFIGFVGNMKSAKLVRQSIISFRKHAKIPSEGGAILSSIPGIGWSDHWSFWQHGFSGIMITDTAPFRYPHYHLSSDTPDKINYEKLALVVSGLEKIIDDLVNPGNNKNN